MFPGTRLVVSLMILNVKMVLISTNFCQKQVTYKTKITEFKHGKVL
jgi:hypothetical protein